MSDNNISKTIDSLLKIAQDMSDVAEEQSQQKATPEQVQDALSTIVSQIQSIIEALPVQGAAPAGEAQPPAEPPVEDERVAKLTQQLEELQQKEAKREIDSLANEIVEHYPESQRKAKYDELVKSDIATLKAKLEAISDFSKTAKKETSDSFSYTRSAKQITSDGRRLTI
jgi:DNA repair exonuclease SbcCD ATPase subunit